MPELQPVPGPCGGTRPGGQAEPVVVFLVLSHHRTRLLTRLLDRLSETERGITVVHHDAKAAERPSLPPRGRVLLAPDPVATRWGDLSLVSATLRTIGWIRREIPAVAWIVLISGQDYPAMSPRRIEAELLASDMDAFIHWEVVPPTPRRTSSDWQRGASKRYYWHRVPGRYRPIPVPRTRFFVDGVGVFAGSQWWNLGRRAVDRILDDAVRLEYLTRRRFRTTLAPDEAFFQTALLNSPLDLRIANAHRRFYRFPPFGGSGHPETLTARDFDAIAASDAFFARKVDEGASDELLDRLDRHQS